MFLGLHDRRKEREPHRLKNLFNAPSFYYFAFLCRKHIRVSKVVVHEKFSTHVNDIALLKLGEFILNTTMKFRFKDSQMLHLSFSF